MTILVALLAIIISFFALYSFFGPAGLIIGLLLLLLAGIVAAVVALERSLIHLHEMEVGVIFNKRTKNFAYFIDSAVEDIENYKFINNHQKLVDEKFKLSPRNYKYRINKLFHAENKYRHFINPFTEKLEDKISKGGYKGSDTTDDLRTREGIPVTIKWKYGFRLDVTKIKSGIEFKMARALPKNAENMIKGKALHSLRHIVEQMSITELHQVEARKSLEEKLRLETLPKIEVFGVIGVNPNNQVQIESIRMPHGIEKALQMAHQRKLQTETVTNALNALRHAIRDFEDADMERLAELERLRIVDEKSAGLVYYMDTHVRQNGERHVHHHNGNGHTHHQGDQRDE